MSRHVLGSVVALILCCAVPVVYGAQRGRGGERQPNRSGGEGRNEGREGREEPGRQPNNEARRGGENNQNAGRKAPGGAWSEDSHDSQNHKGAEGAAAEQHRNQPQATGAQGAAAGAAAAKNKQPNYSGAQGAAAGAAAANKNQPQYSGAQGAAAGAAAANRNQPQYSGAQGAAAGAAAANKNKPQYSGAQGAAAGAAAANRNQPQYSGAQGAAAGAAIANRNSPQFTGAQGAAGYAAVRNSFDHPELYGQGWYGTHPGIWAPAGLAAGAIWAPTAWSALASTNGYAAATPVSYNYGANVTCQNGNVMVDGQSVGTPEEFSQQASDLAATSAAATVADDDKWMPLGVFAMVRNETQHPQMILQMAINQQGVLRGNFTDEVTDHTMPIQGSVDSQTQRAAWTVGDNKDSVMEAGLNNLTQPEARALLHKNGKTQRWLLVRLDQPAAPAQN